MRRRTLVGAIAASSGIMAQTDVKSRFIGVWKLLSCERKRKDGSITYPYGEKPVGRITYDRAGRMSAQLMKPGRKQVSQGAIRDATIEEMREAVTGFTAYYGKFDVDTAAGVVIHHVEAALTPRWVGTDLKRAYEFSGNRLTLTATDSDGVIRLVWERESE